MVLYNSTLYKSMRLKSKKFLSSMKFIEPVWTNEDEAVFGVVVITSLYENGISNYDHKTLGLHQKKD